MTNRCDVLCVDADGMANGNDGPFVDQRYYTVEPGERPVEPQAGRRRHHLAVRHAQPAAGLPHDAANCSPLVYGDCVYVCTANGTNEGKPAMPLSPSLIALDKHTGRLVAQTTR